MLSWPLLRHRSAVYRPLKTYISLTAMFIIYSPMLLVSSVRLPDCHHIPQLLCCSDRVIGKCLSGCMDYVMDKCPHKLKRFANNDEEMMPADNFNRLRYVDNNVIGSQWSPQIDSEARRPSRLVGIPAQQPSLIPEDIEEDLRRSPQRGDYRNLNPSYPVTEVTDADLTTECGVESSKPPYSPCLSRKNVDDLFLSCCQQHVPPNCHSICSYEHREHVAAELLIAAVQQDSCDLAHVSKILYCANQNRDNRHCCEYLGLAANELGVGDRCLRMCNVAASGDLISVLEKEDLVCLSNWNVIMYCARSGLRTIN